MRGAEHPSDITSAINTKQIRHISYGSGLPGAQSEHRQGFNPFQIDQDMIRNDVIRAPICSKLDMSNSYKQVRVEPDDVKNTALSQSLGHS